MPWWYELLQGALLASCRGVVVVLYSQYISFIALSRSIAMDPFIITSSEGPLPPHAPKLILSPRNPGCCEDTAPASFKIKGVEYVREKQVATVHKPRKEASSKVWLFGKALVRKSNKKRFYYCYNCERTNTGCTKLLAIDGSSSARNHMKNTHGRDPVTGAIDAGKKMDDQTVYCVANKTRSRGS